MKEICKTCACFPFCEVEPENCKRYINYTKNEIRKIDEKYG